MFNLKKVYLCFLISAILVALPELTWTYYSDGIKPEGLSLENIIDYILYGLGAIIWLIGALEFKKNPHSA
jgi:hypothetical protein